MTDLTAASKFMSFVLRHNPGAVGLTLDPEGWVSVDDLVTHSDGKLTDALVRRIVTESDKQRFAQSGDGTEIRANQGHSISVDLGLTPQEPPTRLFYGTATRFLDAILAEGLLPRSRQFVHLSKDRETAQAVGMRHGTPVVLTVDTERMVADGYVFLLSLNGIWLTKAVPSTYLNLDSA